MSGNYNGRENAAASLSVDATKGPLTSGSDHTRRLQLQREQFQASERFRLWGQIQRLSAELVQERQRYAAMSSQLISENRRLRKELAESKKKDQKANAGKDKDEQENMARKPRAAKRAKPSGKATPKKPPAKGPKTNTKKKQTASNNTKKRRNVAAAPKKTSKHDMKFEANFQKLLDFKKIHGHVNVPISRSQHLSIWVGTLRTQHRFLREGKPNSLTPERIQRLMSIGFEWVAIKHKPQKFDVRLQQLAAYKTEHGTCNVPQKCKDCPPGLGNFVLDQRRRYRLRALTGDESKLPQERIDALEALGFEWKLRDRGGDAKKLLQQQQQAQEHSSDDEVADDREEFMPVVL